MSEEVSQLTNRFAGQTGPTSTGNPLTFPFAAERVDEPAWREQVVVSPVGVLAILDTPRVWRCHGCAPKLTLHGGERLIEIASAGGQGCRVAQAATGSVTSPALRRERP
jgi:hypothetical protein